MRYSKLLKKLKCVMIHEDSFVVVTLRNELYASVCRSSLNADQSLQFAFIHHEFRIQIDTKPSYSLHFASYHKKMPCNRPRSLEIQMKYGA